MFVPHAVIDRDGDLWVERDSGGGYTLIPRSVWKPAGSSGSRLESVKNAYGPVRPVSVKKIRDELAQPRYR